MPQKEKPGTESGPGLKTKEAKLQQDTQQQHNQTNTAWIAAQAYARIGWTPLPLYLPGQTRFQHGRRITTTGKEPRSDGWNVEPATGWAAARKLHSRDWENSNVGVATGCASGGLLDVDLDSEEAIQVAHLILPPTAAKFGRAVQLRSINSGTEHTKLNITHWLYIASTGSKAPLPSLTNLVDAGQTNTPKVLELRAETAQGKPFQTMFPGSLHHSGVPVLWAGGARLDNPPQPAVIHHAQLVERVRLLHLAVLVGRGLKGRQGIYHNAMLRVAGGLAKSAVEEDDAVNVVQAICQLSGQEGVEDRLKELQDTYRKAREGVVLAGWESLKDYFPQIVIDQLKRLWPDTYDFANAKPTIKSRKEDLIDDLLGTAEEQEALLLDAAEWASHLEPLEYVWDGVVPTGQLIALTGHPSAGKTTLAASLSVHVACGKPFAGHDTGHKNERQAVLYLCGENPPDLQARLRLAMQEGFMFGGWLDVVPVAGPLDRLNKRLRRLITQMRPDREYRLVVVDTATAYNTAEDENNNAEMQAYGGTLRELARLPGRPAVLVLAHPAKGVGDGDALVPRGGSAFLATIDVNLTLAVEGEGQDQTHVLASTKRRGPDFGTVRMRTRMGVINGVVDSRLRNMTTVVMEGLTSEEQRERDVTEEDLIRDMLRAVAAITHASVRTIARTLNWTRTTTLRRLQTARQAGFLTVEGENRNANYMLTDVGREFAFENPEENLL